MVHHPDLQAGVSAATIRLSCEAKEVVECHHGSIYKNTESDLSQNMMKRIDHMSTLAMIEALQNSG